MVFPPNEDPDRIGELTLPEQHILARFFVAQHFRAPAYKEMMDGFFQSLSDDLSAIAKHAEPKADTDQWKPRLTDSTDVADILRGAPGRANLLRTMDWRIGRVPDDVRLNTSDNMMSRHAPPVRNNIDTLSIRL